MEEAQIDDVRALSDGYLEIEIEHHRNLLDIMLSKSAYVVFRIPVEGEVEQSDLFGSPTRTLFPMRREERGG